MIKIYKAIPFFALLLCSCEFINPDEEIPSYIHINSIPLTTQPTEGVNTDNISDAWIYVDDQTIGCFELPATVPILGNGEHKIDIRPGIKINGISATRALYPYYKPYISTVNLTQDAITTVNPVTSYYDNVNFLFIEPFSPSGIYFEKTTNSDTNIMITPSTNAINQGYYAYAVVNNDKKILECKTSLDYQLLKQGETAFLEIDCKSNIPFTLGVFINNASQTVQHPLIVITPSSEWKKVYINLTEIAQRERTAESFKIFFGTIWEEKYGIENGEISIDNIKLIN